VEHNVYFDGKVQSLGFASDEGDATVGVVEPGTYTFPTDSAEQITMLSGAGRVKLPDGCREFRKGDVIMLPADAEVTWTIDPGADACYLCNFK